MPTYSSFSDLLASNNRQPKATVTVLGAYTAGDGGGGIFYWDETSTVTANGETILAVTGIPTGRWILLIGNELTATVDKGDMLVNNGNGLTRLPKPSSANLVLTSDINGSLGVAWASGGGGLDGADIYPSEPAYPQFFQLQASGSVLANSASIAKDLLNLYPITFPAQMLAKQIGMRYSSGGDASFKLKFGLYDLNDPRNLVWESSEKTVTAAGTYSDPTFVAGPQNPLLSPLNVTIEPKTYLFAVLHNSVLSPIFLGGSSGTTKPVLYADSGGTGEILSPLTNRLSFTQVYASSLPASLTGLPGASSANNTVNIPHLFFRT